MASGGNSASCIYISSEDNTCGNNASCIYISSEDNTCAVSTSTTQLPQPLPSGTSPPACGVVSQGLVLGTADFPSTFPSPLDGHLIHVDDITPDKWIGQGAFGSLCLAFYKGHKVVCKIFHIKNHDQAKVHRSYLRELKAIQLQLNHVNIVTMLGATSLHASDKHACIVMRYGGCLNLQSYLQNPGSNWSLHHSLFCSSQIMKGLEYLHSQSILHLDLKPSNCVLCPKETVIRLCDFGLMHTVDEVWDSHRGRGTVGFCAPELFHAATPGFHSDIFSLAVTMWCFDSPGHIPYHGMSISKETIKHLTFQYGFRPPVPTTDHGPFTDRYRVAYTACWASHPAQRPSLSQVMAMIAKIMLDLDFDLDQFSFASSLCLC